MQLTPKQQGTSPFTQRSNFKLKTIVLEDSEGKVVISMV